MSTILNQLNSVKPINLRVLIQKSKDERSNSGVESHFRSQIEDALKISKTKTSLPFPDIIVEIKNFNPAMYQKASMDLHLCLQAYLKLTNQFKKGELTENGLVSKLNVLLNNLLYIQAKKYDYVIKPESKGRVNRLMAYANHLLLDLFEQQRDDYIIELKNEMETIVTRREFPELTLEELVS